MRGLAPFYTSGTGKTNFPHTIEDCYVPWRPLMTGLNTFNWSSLETILGTATADGCQAEVRVFMDYPKYFATQIPQFLLDGGLVTSNYTSYGNGSPQTSLSPNYEDANLRTAMTNFIAAFGARYDGDPRIACVELGLLGFWGEWHTELDYSPYTANVPPYASTNVQREVMEAYVGAFTKTKLLVTNPGTYRPGTPTFVGQDPSVYPLGYHDDSICQDTIWMFVNRGLTNPPAGLTKWQTQMIGGEASFQACAWSSPTCAPAGEEFDVCTAALHSSWVEDDGVFSSSAVTSTDAPTRARAMASVLKMGYELFVSSYAWTDSTKSLTVTITNTGIAPFYYPWVIQVKGNTNTWNTTWDLRPILPGVATNLSISLTGVDSGSVALKMKVINPFTNGIPLSFANATQDTNTGWLSLGTEVSTSTTNGSVANIGTANIGTLRSATP